MAVGAQRDDDGATNAGAVWILFLNANGTVKAQQKISLTAGGFGGSLDALDNFGSALANVGDLNGDGRDELAVGVEQSDVGGQDAGAVWILFLNSDGTVASEREIASSTGGLPFAIDPLDRFGTSIAGLGDIDLNGVEDIAVGASGDDDGGNNRGAVYLLSLNVDGSVGGASKISNTAGNFQGTLQDNDQFGAALAALGDLEGDGRPELAVGAPLSDVSGTDRGQVWILSLESGDVSYARSIAEGSGGFVGPLGDGDGLGASLAYVGDLDGDGEGDVAIGTPSYDGAGFDIGAVWVGLVGDLPSFANVNGSGVNPQCLLPTNPPILGSTWELAVSTFQVPGATMSFVVAFDQPLTGVVLSVGELLVDPFSAILFQSNLPSQPLFDVHSIPIANDPVLLGRPFVAQAGVFAGTSLRLCNGIEFFAGR